MYAIVIVIDFNIENSTIVFPPTESNQTECTDVTIVSDELLEREEIFCLNLSSSDPDVTIAVSLMTTCIMIADNNSEF